MPSRRPGTMLNQAAIAHLTAADPLLGQVIARGHGIAPRPHEDLYLALLRAIRSPKSGSAAERCWMAAWWDMSRR